MMMVRGSEMCDRLQRQALARYPHRFTRDHKPDWATGEWKDGKPYPVQFDSDADWLANTFFPITVKGEFSRREKYCESHPTWPDNPELRTPK